MWKLSQKGRRRPQLPTIRVVYQTSLVVVLFLSKNKTSSFSDDDDNGEDSVENSLGEDIEEDRVDIWHSSP